MDSYFLTKAQHTDYLQHLQWRLSWQHYNSTAVTPLIFKPNEYTCFLLHFLFEFDKIKIFLAYRLSSDL